MAQTTRWMLLFLLLALLFSMVLAPRAAARDTGSSDMTSGIGCVTTDLGLSMFFEVTKPHLLETLSVGARVTMEIDKQGRANKIIDASRVEFFYRVSLRSPSQ